MRTLYHIARLRLRQLTVADASNVTSQHRVEPLYIARELDVAQGVGKLCADCCSEGNGAPGDPLLAKVRVSLTSRRYVTGAPGLGPGSGDTGWWLAGRCRRTVS